MINENTFVSIARWINRGRFFIGIVASLFFIGTGLRALIQFIDLLDEPTRKAERDTKGKSAGTMIGVGVLIMLSSVFFWQLSEKSAAGAIVTAF